MSATATAANSPYQVALDHFDRAADALALDESIRSLLRYPERILSVGLPVRMEGGRITRFEAQVVEHSTALGPAEGGVRFHPGLELDELKALAMGMTWKCALAHRPFGGGWGGIRCNPKQMTPGEMERLSRRYDGVGLPKLPWRSASAGRSLFQTIAAACRYVRLRLDGARAVVQGFGFSGAIAAELLHKAGARVIAASDPRGCLFKSDGLHIPELSAFKARTGSIADFPAAEAIGGDQLARLDCDILVSAAQENALTEENVARVRARVVAEATDGAVSAAAERTLERNGALVIPEIVSGAGANALAEALKSDGEWKVGIRLAAYMLAVGRVASATATRAG